MPSHQSTKTVTGLSTSSILAICYNAFESLGWKAELAAGNSMAGYTKQTWKRYANEILVEINGEEVSVTSKMIHGEIADMFGRTKKDVADFFAAFDTCRANFREEETDTVPEHIRQMQETTVEKAAAEIRLAEETEKVMKSGSVRPFFTYLLIVINCILFIAMVVTGADLMNPDADTIVKWGGNIADLTTNGEAWRLLSNLFIHIGILHLLFNMYGLFYIGRLLEPMLGMVLFAAAYLFSGVVASLVSLWWHQHDVLVSAGASGAIFGMFGLFISLLLTDLIPRALRGIMLQSTGVFVGYNLIMGIRGGVDNAAHIGGLLGGVAAGFFIYHFALKKEAAPAIRKTAAAGILLLAAGSIALLSLKSIEGPGVYLNKTAEEKYNETITAFTLLEKEALEVYEKSNTLSRDEYIRQLKEITLENFKKGEELFRELGSMRLNEKLTALQPEMVKYCRLNQERAKLNIRIFSELSQEYNEALNKNEAEIEQTVLKIQQIAGFEPEEQ